VFSHLTKTDTKLNDLKRMLKLNPMAKKQLEQHKKYFMLEGLSAWEAQKKSKICPIKHPSRINTGL
jgi:hypothetical protein